MAKYTKGQLLTNEDVGMSVEIIDDIEELDSFGVKTYIVKVYFLDDEDNEVFVYRAADEDVLDLEYELVF
jgi:hypothetical protein